MTSRWNATRALLDAKLMTLSGITESIVSFPGRTFTPPTSGTWYKVNLIPTACDSALGVGGYTNERGVYQVSIFNKPGDAQPGATLAAVDALVNLFDRATLTGTGLSVQCEVPVPGPSMNEPDWIQTPVSIRFTTKGA